MCNFNTDKNISWRFVTMEQISFVTNLSPHMGFAPVMNLNLVSNYLWPFTSFNRLFLVCFSTWVQRITFTNVFLPALFWACTCPCFFSLFQFLFSCPAPCYSWSSSVPGSLNVKVQSSICYIYVCLSKGNANQTKFYPLYNPPDNVFTVVIRQIFVLHLKCSVTVTIQQDNLY